MKKYDQRNLTNSNSQVRVSKIQITQQIKETIIKITRTYNIESSSEVFYRVVEAVNRKCSVTKIFLKISQNSQKNHRAEVSFEKIEKKTPAQAFSC